MPTMPTPRLALPALALLGLLPGPAHATDFLVIVLDDLGADKVSAWRDDVYPGANPVYVPETPTLDALARTGLRFVDTYAQPACSPSRASLLTGMYPFQHDIGVIEGATTPELSTDLVTLPEMLASTGGEWHAALFGKWQLGITTPEGTAWALPGLYSAAPAPSLHGFSIYAGDLIGILASYTDWSRRGEMG